MQILLCILILIVTVQILSLMLAIRNYRYVMQKFKRDRSWYQPKTVLIVPCKGKDTAFEKNIESFYNLDFDNYTLWFVLESTDDLAYKPLMEIKEKLQSTSKVNDVQIHIAGLSTANSQKLHNLLYCYKQLSSDIEIMAFADSDICVKTNWLSHIIYPLRKDKYGAASGYRWYVPQKNNFASLAIYGMNGKVAQQLGNSPFNQAWGGSMAIRADVFKKIGLDKIWQNALSDDLSLTYAVKKAKMKLAFIPACLVPSYETFTFKQLVEFGRRQFLITRICSPKLWLFSLFILMLSVVGLWGSTALAIYALATNVKNAIAFIPAPFIILACQISQAVLRQSLINKLLEEDKDKIKAARAADICLTWLWSLLMLGLIISSAFGRIIKWRGIKYKLISPTQTEVIRD